MATDDTEMLAEADDAFWREQEAGNTKRDRGGYYADGWKDGYAARIVQARAGEGALREVLAELVALKDGPRDAAYRATKEGAWDRARAALAETDRP